MASELRPSNRQECREGRAGAFDLLRDANRGERHQQGLNRPVVCGRASRRDRSRRIEPPGELAIRIVGDR